MKREHNTFFFRCIYCGFYSCDKKYCLYKNKHIKLIKKHVLKNHTPAKQPEIQERTHSIKIDCCPCHRPPAIGQTLVIHAQTQTDEKELENSGYT